jgi:type 1 fimbria pilin
MRQRFPSFRRLWFSLVAFALMGGMPSAAVAQGSAAVNVTGRLVGGTCQWDAEGANRTIRLDRVNVAALRTGQATALKAFNLTLINCSPGTARAMFTFSGTPDATDPLRHRNNGTAKGVVVELQSSDGMTIGANGTNNRRTVAIVGNRAVLALQAGYWKISDNASGGTVSATATLTINYN